MPLVEPNQFPGSGGQDPLFAAAGILAWSIDPRVCVNSTPAASGDFHAGAVWLPAGIKITNLAQYAKTAGTAVTHAFLGIYDNTLTRVAETADSPTAFQTTGWITLALTAPYTTPAAGLYYFADVVTATTTMPGTLNGPLIADAPAAILANGTVLSVKAPGFTALPGTMPSSPGGVTIHATVAS